MKTSITTISIIALLPTMLSMVRRYHDKTKYFISSLSLVIFCSSFVLGSIATLSFAETNVSEVNKNPANESPKMVKLVSVSSTETDQITVDWFPVEDNQTSHQNMLYQVHVSPSENFVPDSSTMRYQAKGIITANITDLLADSYYTVMVTATDEDGNESWSNKLSVKTVAIPTTRTHQKVWTPTSVTGRTLRSANPGDNNEIILPPEEPVPEQGEYLVSEQGNGYLKKVVAVSQQNGQTHVQMEQAALTDIFESVEFSTVIKMEEIPSDTNQSQSNLRRKSTGNQHQVTWPESGLTLGETETPGLRKVPAMMSSNNTNRTRRLDISGDTQTNIGSDATFSGPAFIGAKPGEPLLFKLNLKTTDKDVMVCDIRMSKFYHKDKTKRKLPQPLLGQFLPSNYEQNGEITVTWNVTKSHVHEGGLPYYVTFKAYTDDVGEGCNGDDAFATWSDVLKLEIPIYVTMGELPEKEQKSLSFSEGFDVQNTVTIDFKPTIEVSAKIKRASLQEASIIANADLGFRNQLHIAATGQATLDLTKTLLESRSFVKIFVVGVVPIVIRGQFGIDLHVEGAAKGEITLDLDKYFGFPEARFGLRYVKGTGWEVVKNFESKYTFDIKGDGNAGVDLKLALIPDLTLSFYDAASGRMLVEPYLYSNAGIHIHGQFRYQNDNGDTLTDLDYWFTNLEAGGGLDMRLYAGLHIFDYNIASYPKDVELEQTDKFALFKVIDKKPFAKLPELTATYDNNILPSDDSRSILVVGNYKNTPNPFHQWFGEESFFSFERWTKPSIITNRTGAQLVSQNENQEGSYWFQYTQPGDYKIRLAGHSNLGAFIRQVTEVDLSLPDNDNDGMADLWEQRYGITDPQGDPDQDGFSNLQEFQQGKFPKIREANPDQDSQEDSVSDNNNQVTDGTLPNEDNGTVEDYTAQEIVEVFKTHQVTNSNGSKTTVSTFHPSGSINGSVVLESGTLDLKGQTLVIYGNLIHSGGTLKVNKGTLIVKGNYRIQKQDEQGGYTYSSGYLHMTNTEDKVQVNGSFVMDSSRDHSSYLIAGNLEVKGDFQQKSTFNTYSARYNFYAKNNHIVTFSGTTTQTVSFEDPHSSYSHFNVLDIANTSATKGVNFATAIAAAKIQGKGHASNLIITGMTAILTENQTISGNMTLKGGTLDLNNKTFIVNGNLYHAGGKLKVNGGTLIVKGDYRVQKPDGKGRYTYSTGYLYMTNASDKVQVNGSFIMDSSGNHSSYLTAGNLEVKGDFQQKSTFNTYSARYNFYAKNNHIVTFSGTTTQTVSFEDPHSSYSHFNVLDIANTSATKGVNFATAIAAAKIQGKGHASNLIITGMTAILTENRTISGDMILQGGTLDLNSKTFIINGDLYHAGGKLKVNGGTLIVKGDYRVQKPDGKGGYTYSTGYLYMTNASDKVQVNGSFIMDSSGNHSSYLTAGNLEVKGDFQQKSTFNTYSARYNFYAKNNHIVTFSGTTTQTVSFEDPHSSYSHFNVLDITNTSATKGVNFATAIAAAKIQGKGHASNLIITGMTAILTENQTISGNMTLKGGILDLNSKTFIVNGNLYHAGGKLKVNGGTLIVKGDYRVQKPDGKGGYTYSTGYLYMTNASDKVQVNGSFVMDSSGNHANYLTAGNLEVKGDFQQKSTSSSNSARYNFYTKNNHIVTLSGTTTQAVSFEDPHSSYSHFNVLDIANTSVSNGVSFATAIAAAKIQGNGHALNLVITGMTAILTENRTISGDMTLQGGTLDLNGKTFIVNGNLYHAGGKLKVNGGTLIVKGDYRIQKPDGKGGYTYSTGYLYMTNASDKVQVNGSFVMDSSGNHSSYLTAGNLEVKGDFQQKSTSSSNSAHYNFYAKNNHIVTFSGMTTQAVSFEDPHSSYSHFNVLDIANTSVSNGVSFATAIAAAKIQGKGHASNLIITGMTAILTENQTISGNMTLKGGTLDLNSKTFIVNGNLYHAGGKLKVNGGTLIVKGDYRVQKPDGKGGYTYSTGYLYMTNASDKVQVNGSFVMDSSGNHSSYLTAGNLEVKGDFQQKSTSSGSSARDNFYARNNHIVTLSGTKKQTVSFENPHSSYSHFNVLDIVNNSADGIHFNNKIVVTKLFDHHRKPFTLAQTSEFPDYDADTQKDNVDPYPKDPTNTGIVDNSGVLVDIQDAAPNHGDGNGDGILDSEQLNVVSLPNAVDNSYLTLAVNGDGCPIENVEVKGEAEYGKLDNAYDFPQGLIGFELPCESANLIVYYHNVGDTNERAYRKYGPTTPGDVSTTDWYTLSNVTVGTVTIGGQSVATASFSLYDNRLGDDTGKDGIIVDDGGLAIVAMLPNEEIDENEADEPVVDDTVVDVDTVQVAGALCQVYAVNDKGRNNSQFFTISLDDHQVSELGPLYKGHDIEALAIHPTNNLIYAASGNEVANDNLEGHLYLVEGETGELFPIGSTGFTEIGDLAFSPDGTLWAWAKGDGMITLDLTTGAGTLVIPSDVLIEGLTLSKEPGSTVFYGSVNTVLWLYNMETETLEVACTNLLGETEALEMMPDGLLLMGIDKDESFKLHAFDAEACQTVIEANIPTNQFSDVEGIALPIEACAK